MTHLSFPRARRHTRKFYDLSYFNTDTGRYGLGWDDLCMVFFWIVAFTGLRVAVMEYALVVIAQKAQIQKRKDCVRFAEQAWVFFYYGAFWSLGMVSGIHDALDGADIHQVHILQLRLLVEHDQHVAELA